ncbi:MAG: AAA family ATPase [Caldilineaceae bacterium SB0670_bin_27]|uniref:DNA 3'-5' helicase n=1 Tax=Caldilineaceae bacterium SB0664_bin_27 TaxID=2605260 RepID=A0A6B0YTQ3_9CHLR|nr:AAA family ATPase [Caldilineaceae bacterium SB0664_bin_27]MYJ78448.1 AAA family ATPase [Caldilineaceae bacterium SB0670_bin_27]
MKLVADIHLHSHFSRATSKNLTLEHLWKWAQLKGVQVVATGDIAHPGWLAELQAKLAPAEDGLFQLKPECAATVAEEVPPSCEGPVRFLIGGEISNIYKRYDRTRKVHNIVFAPSVEATAILQAELEKIGNIRSDGRPILGLDSRDLLEIVLEVDDRCHLIPAHIWTPWFSILGSKSGFDSVEACFADLTPHIFAVETGLSSDPPMNWRVSWLDDYTLVSNSDAHSPPKLAREATLFDTELSYDALFNALKSGDPTEFLGTIEFFPEEGKYHLDGHRKCGVCWKPVTTVANGGLCSQCGKPVTVGVYHRVEELADRAPGTRPTSAAPFTSLIPLPEALGEILDVGPNSKRVQTEYLRLLGRLGPELAILRAVPLEDISAAGGPVLAEGIRRMRGGEVVAKSGFDGEYGVIRMFDGEADRLSSFQLGIFAGEPAAEKEESSATSAGRDFLRQRDESVPSEAAEPPEEKALAEGEIQYSLPFDSASNGHASSDPRSHQEADGRVASAWFYQLNAEQQTAAAHTSTPLAIVAGPGTGKTRTLTVRIARLIEGKGAAPSSILAVTFTNRAAEEMRERLTELLGTERSSRITVGTFHQLGASLLREFGNAIGVSQNFTIIAEPDRQTLLRRACPELGARELRAALEEISARKNGLTTATTEGKTEERGSETWARYQAALQEANALDFDDLILRAVQLLETDAAVLRTVQARFRWISVDEYQDVNAAQHTLLRLLAAGGANICVIGDPDQAIYGFRGADRRHFLSFEDDFPAGERLHLERNYRSAQTILDAAMQVISHSPDHQSIALIADFAEQVKLDVYRAPTDKAEAEYVVHQVEQMVGGVSHFSLDSGRVDDSGLPEDFTFGDFAVLYRLNAQARLMEEAFDRSGIPYSTIGGPALVEQRPVQEIVALLWLAQAPDIPFHWQRILTEGKRALTDDEAAGLAGRQIKASEARSTPGAWLKEIAAAPITRALRQPQRERLVQTVELVEELVRNASAPLSSQIQIAAAGWAGLRGTNFSEAEEERIERLQRRAAPYRNRLQEFLTTISLHSEADQFDSRADRVTLMSLHAAKGLEFPVVFIAGCEEGLLPYTPSNRDVDLDEERRLFYVGMTRAQRRLVLTHSGRRFLFGQSMENGISGFVTDIETALQEVQKAEPRRTRKRAEDQQMRLF